MTQLPTLAEALAVSPERLAPLSPVGVDRFNAVVWAERARVLDAIDKAADGIHGALLERKVSKRYGRGYRQVWPTTTAEALRIAREHLDSGHQPDPGTLVQYGLYREGAYARGLREALDAYEARQADYAKIQSGPLAVLDDEFERRNGWSRMFLCTSDGGHIHTGRQCPSIGPSTPLAWLPDVSGMDWREAYREVIAKKMAGSTQAIMCSQKTCYPDAPTEWTEKQADPKECPGSRTYARLMDPRMARRVSRYAECHVCHTKSVSVTANGNLRKHDRPQDATTTEEN